MFISWLQWCSVYPTAKNLVPSVCVLPPPPHYSYVTAVFTLHDLPGAQLFHVDVSVEQFHPTALQQETKMAAPPAVCFLPMST